MNVIETCFLSHLPYKPLFPKIAIFASFANGFELLDFATQQDYPIQFVATCDKDTSEYEEKIANLCKEKGIKCIRKVNANDPLVIANLKELAIDFVLLIWWPSLIKKEAIEAANIGWINLHTSLLPYNRGMHPYYWAIVDGTPFGVTLHFVEETLDSGPIIFQKKIPIYITDTGESLYARLTQAALDIFKENYIKITKFDFIPIEQDKSLATFHWAKDIEPHSLIDLEKEYKAKDIIDIIRARTFWKGNSASFIKDGKRYFIRINITEK